MPNLETESKNKSKTWVSFGPVWPSCLNLLFGHWQFRAQMFLGQQFYHYASPDRFLQYSQKLTTVLNPPIRWWVIFRNPIRKASFVISIFIIPRGTSEPMLKVRLLWSLSTKSIAFEEDSLALTLTCQGLDLWITLVDYELGEQLQYRDQILFVNPRHWPM